MTIRAGSLDDTSWLRPAAHFFMRSAQPWETIAGECYDTARQISGRSPRPGRR